MYARKRIHKHTHKHTRKHTHTHTHTHTHVNMYISEAAEDERRTYRAKIEAEVGPIQNIRKNLPENGGPWDPVICISMNSYVCLCSVYFSMYMESIQHTRYTHIYTCILICMKGIEGSGDSTNLCTDISVHDQVYLYIIVPIQNIGQYTGCIQYGGVCQYTGCI